jgi:hypothetical protein
LPEHEHLCAHRRLFRGHGPLLRHQPADLVENIANRRAAGVSTDFFRTVQKRVRTWGDQVGALAGQEEGGQERDHI